jgi:SAM-dependent methyltransferase
MFLEELEGLGVPGWTPTGRFDSDVGVWVTESAVDSSFPESGVDVFNAVDQHSFWFAHRNEVIADVLEREVPTGRPFLEVGSGSGVVVDYLRRHTNRPVASVEPIPAGALAVARRGVRLSFCGDLASLELPPKSLSAVGAFDVVEHLDDPRTFLQECLRVMKDDGRLVLTVPAYPWLWSRFDVWNGHVQRFTLSGLSRLLEEEGFEPITRTYLFSTLLPPAIVTRLILEKLRRKPQSEHEIETHLEEALSPTSPILARSLRGIHRLERVLLRRVRLPFGTSVLMTAKPRSH